MPTKLSRTIAHSGVDHAAVALAAQHRVDINHALDHVDLADRSPKDDAAGPRARISVTREVERLRITGPFSCPNRRAAARARVSSSPI